MLIFQGVRLWLNFSIYKNQAKEELSNFLGGFEHDRQGILGDGFNMFQRVFFLLKFHPETRRRTHFDDAHILQCGQKPSPPPSVKKGLIASLIENGDEIHLINALFLSGFCGA